MREARRLRAPVEPSPDNHDRWLVSYADFMTLLFAFFVVMFASSQTDVAKMRAISRSVSHAFRGHAGAPADGTGGLTKAFNALSVSLSKEIASNTISLSMEPRGLVISLRESGFFASGSEALLPAAISSMHKIADIIGRLPNAVRLEGHTDSLPISNSRFRNNWELASARGVAVLQSFQHDHEIPANRLAVVSYGDTMPKASNATEEGRAANRRVDVAILNDLAARMEAKTSPSGR